MEWKFSIRPKNLLMMKKFYRSSLVCLFTCHVIALSGFSPEFSDKFNFSREIHFQNPALETPDLQPDHDAIETDIYVSYIHNPNEGSMTEIYRSRSMDAGYELIASIPAEQSEYVDRDLSPRTDYYYKLRAAKDGQYSGFNEPTRYTTYSISYKPDLSASALDENTIELTFTDKSYNDSRYVIYGVNPENEFFEDIQTMTDSGRTVKFTHEGVNPATTYEYTVYMETYDDQAHENAASASATTPGDGGDDPIFTATAIDPHTIEVTLTDRSNDDEWYEIYGFELYERVTLDSGETVVFREVGLESGTRYGYGVDMMLKDGTMRSSVASEVVTTPFAPPQFGPFREPYDETTIQFSLLSSNPTSTNEIYRSTREDSGYELIATQRHSITSFTDTNVESGVTYYYKARAFNNDPELTSEFSETRRYKTHSRNYNPTLTARALDSNTIELTLTDHENNDDYYHIGGPYFNEFVSMPDSGSTVTFIQNEGVSPGNTYHYQVTAFMTVYEDANISYVANATVTIPANGACTASGSILREYWNGVQGSNVSQIPVDTEPSGTAQLSVFEGPTNNGIHYGARIRGYVCVPASGTYTFWIASNDHSELWLSTDSNPDNKVKIASVTGATAPREWDKYTSQKSAPITLEAGQRYYIEALHKQGVGTDNVAVGWQLPDETMERPIQGWWLSPFAGEEDTPVVSITSPEEGETFNAPATINIEVEASSNENIVKVEFFEAGNKIGEDLTYPYGYTWADVPEGDYSLTAKATNEGGATGTSSAVAVTVMGGCTASGTITREYWGGVQGSSVSDIPVHRDPDAVNELTIFEGPSNSGIHYGSRIRGYICPPSTGNYVFYIASNDHSELWLSTDADQGNRTRIASVTGATGSRQWDKYASQQSLPILLEEGRKYYIEALHKQGVGTDNIAVAWRLPEGTMEAPIPGSRLSPFEETERFSSENSLARQAYEQINIYPNPVQGGAAALTVSGYDGIRESVNTSVEIINVTGEVVFRDNIRCGGDCSQYLMNIDKQLTPGVYLVKMRADDVQLSRRLLVK